jgi:CheY-like chemotaxis protein
MVVDDNDLNRDVLKRRLERGNYRVTTVESGRKAVEILALERHDAVLLDIMMPEMDGFETLQKIRENDALEELPIIMLTSINSMEDVKRCISLGANDYVLKPYSIEDLNSRLKKVLK